MPPADTPPLPGRRTWPARIGWLLLSVALHGLALLIVTTVVRAPELTPPAPIAVDLLAPPRPAAHPQAALTTARQPEPKRPAAALPASRLVATVAEPESPPLAATSPAPPALPAAAESPAPQPIQLPRFDAAYLRNPRPEYPAFSRRLNEQGTVHLRVHVSSGGLPERVEIAQSSGFPRLDAAASDAVQHWRFVPARRGTEPVAEWVLVPLTFTLER